jgi:signal transduction histidine kinase
MKRMRGKLGITGKLVVSSVCIFAGLWLAMTLYSVNQLQKVLYEQNVRRVEAQVLNWIEANLPQITITRDPANLEKLLRELRNKQGISYVVILDAESRLLAQSGLPPHLADQGPARLVAGITSRLRQTRDSGGRRFLELQTPVRTSGTGMSADLQTMFELAAGNTAAGHIRAGIEQRNIDRELTRLAPRLILLYALLVLVALAINITYASRVATPVKVMARVAKQFSAGDLSERVERGLELRDEVGELARNFNQMADRLEKNREEMNALYAGLERKVAERTLELEHANRRLQELDSLKSDFLSTVSHELRTPLTSIKAYAQILLDSPLDEPTKKRYLDIIDEESDRLTRLISDLLDLAKIEKQQMSWAMVPGELPEIVSRAVNPLVALANARQIRLDVAFTQRLPICADTDRIQQVVTNIVGNAIKFSPAGGRIEIRIKESPSSGPRADRPGRFAVVAVSDTGPGIPRGERERIFSKFYKPPGKHSSRTGTGLGLAISREIVVHHHGEIWVESEPGCGSTFYFTLPLRIESEVLIEADTVRARGRSASAEEDNGV